MRNEEIEEFLQNYESAKSCELLYSIFLYLIMILSILLNLLIFFMFFGQNSRLGSDLRLIFMHSIVCSVLLTVIICSWQVRKIKII